MTRLGFTIASSVLLAQAVRGLTVSFGGVRSNTQNAESCRVVQGVFLLQDRIDAVANRSYIG